MSAQFIDADEGITRNSGIVAPSGDYTWYGRFSVPGTPAGGTFRTFAYIGNDPATYTEYVWVGQHGATGLNAGKLELSISANPSTFGPVLDAGTTHDIFYVRTGNLHEVYLNGVLATSQTVNVSAETWTDLYVGTDTYAIDWDPGAAELWGEWTRALTEDERQLIRLYGPSSVPTDLWTDTPLEADLLDDSGNGHDWSESGGTITFGTDLGPTNTTQETAYVIPSFPFDLTQTLTGFGNRLWFLVPDEDYVLSALACNADRNVVMEIWRDSDGLREDDFDSRPHVWPVNTGDRIWLAMYLFSGGSIPPISPNDATISAEEGPQDPVQPGDLLILTDDQNLNLYDPTFRGFNPEAFFDPVTGDVRHTSARFPTAELGASLLNGVWASAIGAGGTVADRVRVFLWEVAPSLASIDIETFASSVASLGSNLVDKFYVARQDAGAFDFVHTLDAAGNLGGTTWNVPDTDESGVFFELGSNWDGRSVMGVSRDDSILYFGQFRDSGTLTGIGRHDLLTDTQLSSFPPILTYANLRPQDVIVLSDDTILTVWTSRPFVGATSSWNSVLVQYAPNGSILMYKEYPGVFLHHIVHQADDDPSAAWIWILLSADQVADGSGSGKHIFQRVRMADGAILHSFEKYVILNRLGPYDIAGNCDPQRFGAEDSCPLVIMMNAGAEPPEPPVVPADACPADDFPIGLGSQRTCSSDSLSS